MPERMVNDWVEGFMYFTSESECPDSYLKWSALHTISAAIQRKTWAPWVYTEFYPNLYIMLVGPPGVTHKNSAIRFSRNMLKEIGIPLASEAVSKEKLILQMTHRSKDRDALTVMASEFATFLRTSGASMVEFLTDIFDCEDDFEYGTKHGGVNKIPLPYLTMFTGATPGWLANEFDQTFIEGGFAARTLFVAEWEPRFRKAFAHVSKSMLEMRKALVHDLDIIATLEGEFLWTDEAVDWWEHWYEKELPKEDIDYRLRGYLGRKPTHVLKVAQLLCINEGDCTTSEDLRLEPRFFQAAAELLSELEPNMVRAFSSVGRNEYANDLERIAHGIENSGGMPWSKIIEKNVHAINRQELEEIIKQLRDMGKIEPDRRQGEVWYIPVTRRKGAK